jgi:uncharacterized protein YdiU (UPF0061 family)
MLEPAKFLNLGKNFYHEEFPEPFENPELLLFNKKLATELKIENFSDIFPYFTFEKTPKHSVFSSVYSGHQFGIFVPQLGDGRLVTLGEIKTYEIQIKGSGPTAFSRGFDGRAVLRSVIREFLVSEHFHSLGIPTTRALGIIKNDSFFVQREKRETAAMLIRASESHIRFGHFEYFYYSRQLSELKKLLDFTIHHFFSEFEKSDRKYSLFFEKVMKKTAEMLAKWISFGFFHGVMNTDNMSILGLTIDYGPFAFMEKYDPKFNANHSDGNHRYSFNKQAEIALWNLNKLAQTLTPFIEEKKLIKTLESYSFYFENKLLSEYKKKFGFYNFTQSENSLIFSFLDILERQKMDYTLSFYYLTYLEKNKDKLIEHSGNARELINWLLIYEEKIKEFPKESEKIKKVVNPKYILRTSFAQKAIENAERGNNKTLHELFSLIQNPFSEEKKYEKFLFPPENTQEIYLSCSS